MAKSNSENEVGIVVTYYINGCGEDQSVHAATIPSADTKKSNVGRPKQLVPGDYSYSGRHDHGELPPLREQTELGRLLVCVKEAKERNDRFITEKIQEFKNREMKEDDCDPPTKKPKVKI
ncbi:unnamed protein product [Cylindrotheca closterium]|uniref:Uncharacterized protein n=1 Tax=Cylindrotheca closterium TaxID=2856 RepID=A0AAD2PUK6_9STRA|nr:unnamed protein product [Cylindrotheca closterium]